MGSERETDELYLGKIKKYRLTIRYTDVGSVGVEDNNGISKVRAH